jgi:hypothetical protein
LNVNQEADFVFDGTGWSCHRMEPRMSF